MKIRKSILLCLVTVFMLSPNYTYARKTAKDSVAVTTTQKEKTPFLKKLMKPLKWVGKNWSACDPQYAVPSFYNWAVQLQNTFSQEQLSVGTNDDYATNFMMRSKISSKIGPYFGYNWLFYGYTVDLYALKGTNRRNEFTLSINSALANIDVIRRRTGGDFTFRDLSYESLANWDSESDVVPRVQIADMANKWDLGDAVKYGITGINMNFFLNHKKYSNPAAFSNGAIQLRSAGSPIVGLGYTHHKLETQISDLLVNNTLRETGLENKDIEELNELRYSDKPKDQRTYRDVVMGFLESCSTKLDETDGWQYIYSTLPTTTTIDDWHLQLGYAYNIVFSRRLLLGLSAIVSPSIKRFHSTNEGSFQRFMAQDLADYFNEMMRGYIGDDPEYVDLPPESFYYDEKSTNFNVNLFGRASLVWNYNRWRAGLNLNVNRYFFSNEGNSFDNRFGNLAIYVGYCFGRKKEFRWNGEKRQQYIQAALTKKDIIEMQDTMPAGNVDHSATDYLAGLDKKQKKMKYRKDEVNLNFFGSDLVKGPDGKYGTFEVEDGYVTDGQDPEGRLAKGTVLDMDKTGSIFFSCGHDNSFRTANWWKSQLSIDQTSLHWYPEMLHYAIRGKLTIYLRNRTFGTKKPVKVVIPDFIIAHGMESKEFYQIGAKGMESHSTYSLVGNQKINGKKCRIYMETKKRGKVINVYINRILSSSTGWMKNLPDDMCISTISLPGTHDAGSASLPESSIVSTAHTQNFTIGEQVYDGIRAFDIRLKKNMKYGHTLTCRNGLPETMTEIREFLTRNPKEMLVFMIGSDEGGDWSEEMKENFKNIINEYSDLFIDDFDGATRLGDVRGKILVIKRQEECPYGKLLKFEDNSIFEANGFHVEDVYKEHKTWKKIKLVQQHLREAYENDDPTKWYITFNSIAWGPQHHKPYYSAWGATNVRRPMNKALREVIEMKDYNNFGIVFLDFYNDHGDSPQLVQSIIKSNYDFYRFE